jgi:hypothetical protein
MHIPVKQSRDSENSHPHQSENKTGKVVIHYESMCRGRP